MCRPPRTSWNGLGRGLLAALSCGVVPIGIIALGVRRGAPPDRHIRVRRRRVVPMSLSPASVVAGVAPGGTAALTYALLT
ncbi:hypothetical protein [Streptomyces sp. CLCI03]